MTSAEILNLHYLLVCRISSAIPWQLQTGWISERREWLQRLVERPQKRSGDISAVCWWQTLLLRCCTLVQSVTAVLCFYYQFRLILPHPILYRLHEFRVKWVKLSVTSRNMLIGCDMPLPCHNGRHWIHWRVLLLHNVLHSHSQLQWVE